MFGRSNNPRWCCGGFPGSYEQAGQRGLSVLIDKDDQMGGRFLIQARAVDRSDQEQLQGVLGGVSLHVSLVSETGMLFCPWCGTNLRRFYGGRVRELDRPGLSISLDK